MKLRNDGNDTHLSQLLNSETNGLYLCGLKTKSGMNSHVIGIDCTHQKIYDCEEEYALPLSEKNISHCCGNNSGGLAEVNIRFLVQETPRKKRKKLNLCKT